MIDWLLPSVWMVCPADSTAMFCSTVRVTVS